MSHLITTRLFILFMLLWWIVAMKTEERVLLSEKNHEQESKAWKGDKQMFERHFTWCIVFNSVINCKNREGKTFLNSSEIPTIVRPVARKDSTENIHTLLMKALEWNSVSSHSISANRKKKILFFFQKNNKTSRTWTFHSSNSYDGMVIKSRTNNWWPQ